MQTCLKNINNYKCVIKGVQISVTDSNHVPYTIEIFISIFLLMVNYTNILIFSCMLIKLTFTVLTIFQVVRLLSFQNSSAQSSISLISLLFKKNN